MRTRLLTTNVAVRSTMGQRRRLADAAGWLALTTADLSRHLGHADRARALTDIAYRFGKDAGSDASRIQALTKRSWGELSIERLNVARRLASSAVALAPAGTPVHADSLAVLSRVAARQGDSDGATLAFDQLRDATDALPAEASADLFVV